MKFCKNLQRVVEISDPEWAPYWINYKHLKKLIKGIVSSSTPAPSAAADASYTSNVASLQSQPAGRAPGRSDSQSESSTNAGSSRENHPAVAPPVPAAAAAAVAASPAIEHQSQGDDTSERRQPVGQHSEDLASSSSMQRHPQQHARQPAADSAMLNQLGKSPGERAFFKLLHSEVKKSTHFFEQAQKEYAIREERVRKGMEIIKSGQSGMSDADERWSRCAQSIFRLYRELLLLETYCIMTFCGFSKILKKHDKNTGHNTRNAFMAKIVNQSNFVTYPRLLQMIRSTEELYEDVSSRLVEEGKNDLHEDERLFIHMIHRLNAQVVGGDGTTTAQEQQQQQPTTATAAKQQQLQQQQDILRAQLPSRTSPLSQQEAWKAQCLKELVAENDTDASASRTNNNDDDDSDSDAEDAKPKASPTTSRSNTSEARKRGPESSTGSSSGPDSTPQGKRQRS